jgi:ribosomal protein S18 acetylase RimI-like enzyme
MKRIGRNPKVDIREMRIDDIPSVYRLGRQLFEALEPSTPYRTWDAYEVTANFNNDPRLSLVAEASNGTIVGFALGTTYEKESGGWKYGHLLWMGIRPKWQRAGVGAQLCHEMERHMHQEGVRMVFVDAARSNSAAIRFFKRMGYEKPEAEVWMSKMIQRTGRRREEDSRPSGDSRRRHSIRKRQAEPKR